jgi:ribosomal protein S14
VKKLIEKDKKRINYVKQIEKQNFILKSIFKNSNFFILIRWQAFLKLKVLTSRNSKISISVKCLYTNNKKKFNKNTFFSRHVFLKLIRSGELSGIKKSSW